MISSIDDVYDYVYSFINLEKSEKKYNRTTYSVDNIKNIIKHFDNIFDNQKIIHIAGTKGKGSVAVFISYFLKSLDYNVSTFLSPHLINLNERILYNLKDITDNDLIIITNEVKSIINKNKLTPTTFEILFIIFLLFSKKKNVDYLIVETGIGGRFDCTNIVNPIISVITSISIDHVNILGKSIKNITLEKSGIIKKSIPVVISKNRRKILNILKHVAKDNMSDIYFENKMFKVLKTEYLKNGININFKFNEKYFKNININLLGNHQVHNFLTALLTVYLIDKNILSLLYKKNKVNILFKGRMQQLNDKIILDVAHNKDSAKKLVSALKLHFPKRKWIIVIGIVINKDYNGIIRELSKIADYYIVTKPIEYKESESDLIYELAKKYNKKSIYIKNINDVLDYILKLKTSVLVTGSFYTVGPILKQWNENCYKYEK